MADLLNTALSGLLAFQRGLAVTGNNITNSNTTGYSRELVGFESRLPDSATGVFIGNGVDVGSVNRAYDQFTVVQLRTGNGILGQQNSFLDIANQVDNLVGGTTNGISGSVSAFFNSWQTLASDPTSTSNRAQVLSQAKGLATTITQTANQLDALQGNVNTQLKNAVTNINSLSTSIAKLNEQIATAGAGGSGSQPNDLLDKRDQLVLQLSSIVSVRTNSEADGTLDVFVGNGQPIVVRNQATALTTLASTYDPTQLDIALSTPGSNQVITSSISGGTIGGLIQATTQIINPALNGLGQISTAISAQVNAQQSLGLDQNGALGQGIFTVAAPAVFAAKSNLGSGFLSLAPAGVDPTKLTASDYVIHFTGGVWSATVADTGQPVTITGDGSALNPLTLDGIALNLSGAPSSGDSFLLKPTAPAARGLAVVLSDPRSIAAASAIKVTAALSNTGKALVTDSGVVASTPVAGTAPNANLLTPASIVFQSPTTYTVNGVLPAQNYTAGTPIQFNGWQVTLTGTPALGDTFQVSANTAGLGDNRNAVAMSTLQSQPVLQGATVGITAAYASLVGTIGTSTHQATIAQSAQQAVVNQAKLAVSSVAGVNLDEEAANMLRWQQAYTASAKIVSTADTIFQTLISSIRG